MGVQGVFRAEGTDYETAEVCVDDVVDREDCDVKDAIVRFPGSLLPVKVTVPTDEEVQPGECGVTVERQRLRGRKGQHSGWRVRRRPGVPKSLFMPGNSNPVVLGPGDGSGVITWPGLDNAFGMKRWAKDPEAGEFELPRFEKFLYIISGILTIGISADVTNEHLVPTFYIKTPAVNPVLQPSIWVQGGSGLSYLFPFQRTIWAGGEDSPVTFECNDDFLDSGNSLTYGIQDLLIVEMPAPGVH